MLHSSAIFILLALYTTTCSPLAMAAEAAPKTDRDALVRRIQNGCVKGIRNNGDIDAPPVEHPEQICSCISTNLDHRMSTDELLVLAPSYEEDPAAEREMQKKKYLSMIEFDALVNQSCRDNPAWIYKSEN
jgi:hypothetical protein